MQGIQTIMQTRMQTSSTRRPRTWPQHVHSRKPQNFQYDNVLQIHNWGFFNADNEIARALGRPKKKGGREGGNASNLGGVGVKSYPKCNKLGGGGECFAN